MSGRKACAVGAAIGVCWPALVLAAMAATGASLHSMGLLKGERPFLFLAAVLFPAPAFVFWKGGWRSGLAFAAGYLALAFVLAFLLVRVMLMG